MGYKDPITYRKGNEKGGGVATYIKLGLDSEESNYTR